jgi:Flp pilus assembly protein TadG
MIRQIRERGSAIIEFALLIMVLMLLFLGVVDFSMAITKAVVISGAAEAGARYGASEGNSNNTAAMAGAATSSAGTVSGMTATASTWCVCSVGGAVVSCAITCNLYDLPIQYVEVQTSATIPLLFHFAGIPLNIQMNGLAILRAR